MKHHLRRIVFMSIFTTILTACAGKSANHLGVSDGRLTACPRSPNCVSSQAEDEAHRITPLVFQDTPDMAFARLKQVLDGRGDTTILNPMIEYRHKYEAFAIRQKP